MTRSKLGIVAGGGALPVLLAEACAAERRPFLVIAIEGQADAEALDRVCAPDQLAWTPIGTIGSAIDVLRTAGVRQLVLAGRVRRPGLSELRADRRAFAFLTRVALRGLGDDGLLRAVVHELEKDGFEVIGPDAVLDALLAGPGQLGGVAPDEQGRADILRGIAVARRLGAADVGQAVVVQQGIVLGLEAVEGTDALIDRCALLRREGGGGVLVKLCKPHQEARVDLPTIGLGTVAKAAAAGLAGVAVEAGGTLILDREGAVAAADAAGMFLVGLDGLDGVEDGVDDGAGGGAGAKNAPAIE